VSSYGEAVVPPDPIRIEAERLQQRRRHDAALAIEVGTQRRSAGVEKDLEPRPELGEDVPLVLVLVLLGEVDARRAGQLVDQRVFGPVDDERAATRHHREIPDVELRLLEQLPFLEQATHYP
jgi:hypothetical protein